MIRAGGWIPHQPYDLRIFDLFHPELLFVRILSYTRRAKSDIVTIFIVRFFPFSLQLSCFLPFHVLHEELCRLRQFHQSCLPRPDAKSYCIYKRCLFNQPKAPITFDRWNTGIYLEPARLAGCKPGRYSCCGSPTKPGHPHSWIKCR